MRLILQVHSRLFSLFTLPTHTQTHTLTRAVTVWAYAHSMDSQNVPGNFEISKCLLRKFFPSVFPRRFPAKSKTRNWCNFCYSVRTYCLYRKQWNIKKENYKVFALRPSRTWALRWSWSWFRLQITSSSSSSSSSSLSSCKYLLVWQWLCFTVFLVKDLTREIVEDWRTNREHHFYWDYGVEFVTRTFLCWTNSSLQTLCRFTFIPLLLFEVLLRFNLAALNWNLVRCVRWRECYWWISTHQHELK